MAPIVSVWLPHLPIERLQRESKIGPWSADRPFALVGNEERGLILTALNAQAVTAGLYHGVDLADARAICPALLTAPAEPEKDRDCLLALARWSSRYSPSLNVDDDDGLWLDVAGISHLFGGARALLADMARRFARLGFSARLALAETLGGAHALARFAPSAAIVIPQGKIGEALISLPVEGLRLTEDTTRLLRRLGLKRIGQLYDLPRASLEWRFHARDAAEAVLNRLDQALGRRDEVCAPLFPAPDCTAKLPFPEPLITHEGLVAGLAHLAQALADTLARAGRGAKRIKLTIYRADGSSAMVDASFTAPARDPRHLTRILQDKIDTVDAGFGVDLMTLAALITEPLLPAQSSFATSDERGRQGELIDRLANRLSRDAVRKLLPRASHIPERAQAMASALDSAAAWPEQPTAGKPQRPLLIFATPEPLEVLAEVPEGPPARFTWRRVTRRVVKVEGPERITPEWWREFACVSKGRPRDYYRIEDDEGHRYWVFRDGLYQDGARDLPAWYLHGMFG
jgi:protein ImuB